MLSTLCAANAFAYAPKPCESSQPDTHTACARTAAGSKAACDDRALGTFGWSPRSRDVRPDTGEGFGLGLHFGKLTRAQSQHPASLPPGADPVWNSRGGEGPLPGAACHGHVWV